MTFTRATAYFIQLHPPGVGRVARRCLSLGVPAAGWSLVDLLIATSLCPNAAPYMPGFAGEYFPWRLLFVSRFGVFRVRPCLAIGSLHHLVDGLAWQTLLVPTTFRRQ